MRDASELSKIEFAIRPSAEADVPGILKCLADAFEPYRQRYTAQAFADTTLDQESLKARMRSMQVIVAVANGEVVGTIAGAESEGSTGHLRGMAVLPKYRGTGVAAELLAAIEADLRKCGCTLITLNTTEPLLAAMKFYEKHGYARSGRSSDFFGMPLIEYVKEIG